MVHGQDSKVSQEDKNLEQDYAIMLRRGSVVLFPNTYLQSDFALIEVNMKVWSNLNGAKLGPKLER